jgi:magnesium transporter
VTGHQTSDSAGVVCLTHEQIDRAQEMLASGEFFWLDLHAAADEQIVAIGESMGLHPLTIEDLQHFGQRPKIEPYIDEGYVYIVFYGAAPADDDDRLAEIHIIHSTKFLLTARRDDSVELRGLWKTASDSRVRDPLRLLHVVLDTLVDSFGPVLDELDDQIERVEELIFQRALEGRESEIHRLRRLLGRMNRTIHAETESLTRIRDALVSLHGSERAMGPYFRDVLDHLSRVANSADSLRDRLTALSDLYVAALDTRLNMVMKQFTVIAGIFLPLTVLVGYFGQNFKWMTDHVDGWVAFVVWGVALPIAITTGLLIFFSRRRLLKD